MGDLAKIVQHFIYRDFVYIVGGSTVIVSFLYLFGRLGVTPID